VEKLREYFLRTLKLDNQKKPEESDKILSDISVKGIVDYIKSGKCKNIIAMVGAGISTCELY
jgi:hypothetical protein